jgi:putative ABC transport system ATP-binding protein
MVILENVTKDYKLGSSIVHALRGINLQVGKSEFISICGPSGSGKSTLLNLIGCLDSPSSGKVFIAGKDIAGFNDTVLSNLRSSTIGFIFQSFNLIPVLTAYENVEYPLVITGMLKKKRKEKVIEILEEMGLRQFMRHKPDELSGGQRQRIAIARALVTRPEIVLADEPTANLDSSTGTEILKLMKKMNEKYKTTFIFSTHDSNVLSFAQKIYNISDGRLI